MFVCARCRRQVLICSRCDRGQRYCAGSCRAFGTHDFGDHGYGIAIREHIDMHFWLCTERHVAGNTSCHVRVNDIHAPRADLAKRTRVPGIVKTPRGMDELHVHDTNGSLVKFGQVTERFTPAETAREAPSG